MELQILSSLLFSLLIINIHCEKTLFNKYSLLRLIPKDEYQLSLLFNISCNDAIVTKYALDFWTSPIGIQLPVDILVPPKSRRLFENIINSHNISYKVAIPDLQQLIEEEKVLGRFYYSGNGVTSFFQKYQRLNEIYEYLDTLAEEHPSIAKVEIIGKSFEGRPLKLIHVGDIKNKKRIWIDANIHAREWITSATVMFMTVKLVTEQNDPVVQRLLSKYSFTILPVANPDGYEYSHTNYRLWRKTRSFTYTSTCYGVDPNRNWDFHWNEKGASRYSCSEKYAGPRPFSEPETRAMAKYIIKHKGQWTAYLTYHSYSQLILTPWGYKYDVPDNYNELMRVANLAVDALRLRGSDYQAGSSTRILYPAAGGSDDWAMGVAGIKYSYAFELRDKGEYGFVIPPSQIIDSGKEIFEATAVMIDAFQN